MPPGYIGLIDKAFRAEERTVEEHGVLLGGVVQADFEVVPGTKGDRAPVSAKNPVVASWYSRSPVVASTPNEPIRPMKPLESS